MIRMYGRNEDPMGAQVFYNEVEVVSEKHLFRVFFTRLGPMKSEEPFRMVEHRSTRKRNGLSPAVGDHVVLAHRR